jgi:hypothetical protein
MSQLPTEQGYAVPMTTQFSVFLDNRVGKIYELLEALEEGNLTLCGLSVLEAADHGVIRIVTNRAKRARTLLHEHDLPFSESSVLVVEIGDNRTLNMMCKQLREVELSIHFAYPLLVQPNQLPTVALQTDDTVMAGQVLSRKGYVLLGEADLGHTDDGGFDEDGIDPLDPLDPPRR